MSKFFSAKEVEDRLKCSFDDCKKKFKQTAKVLPCGKSICVECEHDLELDKNNQFKCKLCNQMHKMPTDGLPINEAIEIDLKQAEQIEKLTNE